MALGSVGSPGVEKIDSRTQGLLHRPTTFFQGQIRLHLCKDERAIGELANLYSRVAQRIFGLGDLLCGGYAHPAGVLRLRGHDCLRRLLGDLE